MSWFKTRDGLIVCTRCGCPAPVDTISLIQYESNYCPKCGRRTYKKAEKKEDNNEDRLEKETDQ